MTPTSWLEDTKRSDYGLNDGMREEGSAFSQRNAVSTEIEKGLANQRERSMKLNSEGIEVNPPHLSTTILITITNDVSVSYWIYLCMFLIILT